MLGYFDGRYVDRVRAYRGTFPYEKALRKRRVWVEPLFAEAKDRHGLRRFRLRRLEKVNQEALMIAAGQNVERLLAFGNRRPVRMAQAAALRLLGESCLRPVPSHRAARRCVFQQAVASLDKLFWKHSATVGNVPSLSLEEYREAFQEETGVVLSASTVSRAIARLLGGGRPIKKGRR